MPGRHLWMGAERSNSVFFCDSDNTSALWSHNVSIREGETKKMTELFSKIEIGTKNTFPRNSRAQRAKTKF